MLIGKSSNGKNIYKLICLTLPCLIKDDSPETTPPIPSKVKKQHTFESYRRCGRDLPPAGGKPHLQHTMINLWSHETVRESHLKFDKVIFLWKKPCFQRDIGLLGYYIICFNPHVGWLNMECPTCCRNFQATRSIEEFKQLAPNIFSFE